MLALASVAALGLAITAGFFWGKRQTIAPDTVLPLAETPIAKESGSATSTVTEPLPAKNSVAPAATSTRSSGEPEKPKETASDTDNPVKDFERFVIAIGANGVDTVATALLEQNFISGKETFKKLIAPSTIALTPGGYKLSKKMDVARIAKTLQEKPYMVWVIIPEGLRKEETADLLANELEWSSDQKENWINKDTAVDSNYFEGVYFPDTYLIPISESPADVAKRLIAKFNEKFAVYLPEFTRQNIKWTTGLAFASIVQREAANASDMPLIAGILWNRLERGMKLDADATLQYARGNTGIGWWSAATAADKQIDSPYNTYANKSLPPHPICSPGIGAIEATLNPATTECLYYLHDGNRVIHCAKTYDEHLENIEKYLK